MSGPGVEPPIRARARLAVAEAAHDRNFERGEVRAAREEVRRLDREVRVRSEASGRAWARRQARDARRRLVRALALCLLPPGREADGFVMRLDRFIEETGVDDGTLDALARHLTDTTKETT